MVDYVLVIADINWKYYLAAVVIGCLVWTVTRNRFISMFWAYAFITLSISVISRNSFVGRHFEPHLFWSWSVEKLRKQILMNIVGYIPLGYFLTPSLGWRSIPVLSVFSLALEIMQLVTQRGLFEFDDVIHNTLGALIGFILFQLYMKAQKPHD